MLLNSIKHMELQHQISFSILLPVYNNKDDILNAIKSVISQTLHDWELIVIDDCSSDGTYELIQSFLTETNNPNIILLHNDINQGTFISLNKGLLIAKNKYIARIDSDDTLNPIFLEEHAAAFTKNPECLITQSQYRRNDSSGIFGEITTVYNKALIEKIGYYDSVRFAADTEFHTRLRKYYGDKNIIRINKILYNAKIRSGSLTTSLQTGFKGEAAEIRKNYVWQFTEWHNKGKIYMSFPLETRPFEVAAIMLP